MAEKKKVVIKKLVIDFDETTGEFKGGRVLYGLKINGVSTPQNYTMGMPNWFETPDLKKLFKTAKEKIELGEHINT